MYSQNHVNSFVKFFLLEVKNPHTTDQPEADTLWPGPYPVTMGLGYPWIKCRGNLRPEPWCIAKFIIWEKKENSTENVCEEIIHVAIGKQNSSVFHKSSEEGDSRGRGRSLYHCSGLRSQGEAGAE